MSEPKITLRNVSVRFRMSYSRPDTLPRLAKEIGQRVAGKWEPRYFTALDDVTFEAYEGEVIGVVGRNGAGKSTLLRTISGIYYPDDGEVSVNGRVSALLSLGTGFNPLLTGRDNIVLGGLTLGYTMEQIHERMDAILDFAEIGDFADVPMRYYSSGMMGRLSFSVVVTMEPDILLIDETLSVGDLAFRVKAQEAMQKLFERAACQVLVSHSLEAIRQLCTRAILIDGGRLIAAGSTDDIISRYEDMMGHSARDAGFGDPDIEGWEV